MKRVSILFSKPSKVVAELGNRNVYAVSAAERGKPHTVLSCVSASGYVLPPMMVYPRKTLVPDKLKEGALPSTLFVTSESGWIDSQLYIDWFAFFIKQRKGSSVNHRAVCITDDDVLSEMKAKEDEKAEDRQKIERKKCVKKKG